MFNSNTCMARYHFNQGLIATACILANSDLFDNFYKTDLRPALAILNGIWDYFHHDASPFKTTPDDPIFDDPWQLECESIAQFVGYYIAFKFSDEGNQIPAKDFDRVMSEVERDYMPAWIGAGLDPDILRDCVSRLAESEN